MAAKKNNYQSITIYKDMAPQILELEKGEAGEIFQALMRYSCYGEDTDMSKYDRFVRSLWQTIKLKLQAGEEHDKRISEIRAEAGKKGGEAKANKSQDLQANQAKAGNSTTYTITNTITDREQLQPREYERIESNTNDTDSDKDNDSDAARPFSFNVEKAWSDTFNLYPKKSAAVMAKTVWMDKLLPVIKENCKAIALLIACATRMYLADYEERNPDDDTFRYIPKYVDWLTNDCDYWISEYEKDQKDVK